MIIHVEKDAHLLEGAAQNTMFWRLTRKQSIKNHVTLITNKEFFGICIYNSAYIIYIWIYFYKL